MTRAVSLSLAPESFPWPFDGDDWRMTMGVQALAPDRWIAIDAAYPDLMAQRRALLDERPTAVLGYARPLIPGVGDAAAALLALLAVHLPRCHPEVFGRAGGLLHNHLTGEEWDLTPPSGGPGAFHRDNLDLAARLVPEDLCLLLPGPDGRPVLAAAAVCFPNRWRLADKLGRPLAAIHAPVARYASRLGGPVDRFLAALTPARPVWRMNWALNDDPALFQPAEVAHTAPRADLTPANAAHRLWLRVERQTLRRLPDGEAILFTIRTYQRPLADLSPPQAAQLAAVLRDTPDDVAAYKGLNRTRAPALATLDRLAGTPAP